MIEAYEEDLALDVIDVCWIDRLLRAQDREGTDSLDSAS
jgi:hypothetical protein